MSPIKGRELIIDEATKCARLVLQLEWGLEELVTKGSVESEVLGVDYSPSKEYNPHKHEACQFVSLALIYDCSRKEIKAEKEIGGIVKEVGAEFYTLTKPISFGCGNKSIGIQAVMFPVIFYRIRKYNFIC